MWRLNARRVVVEGLRFTIRVLLKGDWTNTIFRVQSVSMRVNMCAKIGEKRNWTVGN